MTKGLVEKIMPKDPYRYDSAFKPARDHIRKYLHEIENVKGSVKSRAKTVIRILDDAGKNTDILIPAIGPAKARIIGDLVKKHKPMNVYEIGTLFGYSAIILAMNMPTNGLVTTIQKSYGNMEIAKKIIKASGLSERIRMVVGDATKMIPHFKDKIDMFLIDGYKSEYRKYLKLVEPHLKIGSIVIADNVLVFEDEMKEFLNHVRDTESGIYKSKTRKTYRAFSKDVDAIEVSEKKK